MWVRFPPRAPINMSMFYDLLISAAIAATALPAVILIYHRSRSVSSWEYRYPSISLVLIVFFCLSCLLLLYGSFIEPRLLVVKQQEYDLRQIKKPVNIILIADPQLGPYKGEKYLNKIIDKTIQLNPDLVLLAGDIINNGINSPDETILLGPLRNLSAKIPTYAVHGNHEYGVNKYSPYQTNKSLSKDRSGAVKIQLEKLGVNFLVNELVELTINHEKIYLFGGDSYLAGRLDFAALEQEKVHDYPVMALIHNPNAIVLAREHGVDLMLSGHTHGGQIRFPFIGPVGRVDSITPTEIYQGSFEFGQTKLLVSSGAGETGPRARLFNPPEIYLINLH